jgi:hypothetical protein
VKKYRPMTLDEAHKAMKKLREDLLTVDPHVERAYEKLHNHPHEPQASPPKSVR